ncbi:MAG: quinolinate synthase [Desulfobacterales bacterium S5133MH4]|nr:MAG: quinolinate synthase [Desulfobacterales bacterium S5133MH4]
MTESIAQEIRALLKKRNAILLAHNYQRPEIQDIADMTGDSLELSIRAAKTDADVIVFCGVRFMAETASIVSPDKTVLIPRMDAGCPMADMITPEALKARLAELGEMPVVTYVNSPASVKAQSTICCTSANAIAVVNSLTEDEILMTPDRNLCQYAASKSNKRIHCWDGYCPIHDRLSAEEVLNVKALYPEALFMAHPECRPEVLALADAALSTSGMLDFAKRSANQSFIVGTEEGLVYPLQKANPNKSFYKVSEYMVCEDMKRTTLDDVLRAITTMICEVKVSKDVGVPAGRAVEQMLKITRR